MASAYADTLTYLYENLPMFQRVGSVAYKKDLTNTIRLCDAVGNPQKKFKSIHVAGTNGKGSSSHMLASVFQSSGYVTGLYTSPHLKEFTERIRINGNEVEKEFVVDVVDRLKPLIEEIHPSFFEITVVMAFLYFAERNVDVAVIEVGLGGRLDSTNIITPELSLITNIGWDHKDILGDTLEKIASEKAGIIKQNVPVVISERQDLIDDVFVKNASDNHAKICFAPDDYFITDYEREGKRYFDVFRKGTLIFRDLYLPLQGYYQKKNLTGVLKSLDILRGAFPGINDHSITDGLKNVIVQTGLKGRWQKLGKHPLIIADTAHNINGLLEVVGQIRAQTFQKLHFIFGVVKDKDLELVLSVLPDDAIYYFCQAKIPRAMDAQQLAGIAAHKGLKGVVVPDVNDALREARQKASADDMIFIGGSTFVVAELDTL